MDVVGSDTIRMLPPEAEHEAPLPLTLMYKPDLANYDIGCGGRARVDGWMDDLGAGNNQHYVKRAAPSYRHELQTSS